MRQLYFLIFMLGLSNSGMTQPAPEKLALCASCHNSNGIAKDNHWPNLAHQSQKYMSQQLKDYQSGQRVSAIMQAYAKLLSDKDIEQLSAYYASQPLPPAPLKRKSPNHQGLSLYKLGNYKQGIPACSACHGPKGLGNDPAKYPALALQNKAYLSQQLYAFKHKERKNDTAAIMQQISERLSEQDIKDVVDYIEDLS